VVLLCDRLQKVEWLAKLLEPLYPREVHDGTLERVIEDLLERDVLMAEGNLILTLPIGYRPRTTVELYRYVLGTHAPAVVDDGDGTGESRSAIPIAVTKTPVATASASASR
jgi:hypothetical protein